MQPLPHVLFFVISSAILSLKLSKAICGQPHVKPLLSPAKGASNRISYGFEARPHSHPWQVLLFVTMNGETRKCGASLIQWKDSNASDLVLTASHCVVDVEKMGSGPVVSAEKIHAYVGVHDITEIDPMVNKLTVVAVAAGTLQDVSHMEDVAILKLERKINFDHNIQGICLPSASEKLPPEGSRCFVTGWGILETGDTATRLQQIEVFIHEGRIKHVAYNKKRMLCALKNDNEGPAEGDSGGPLACFKNGTFVLYGIVSIEFSMPCNHEIEHYVAFTKVSKHLSWVTEKIAQFEIALMKH
uniref:Peptidase S1 domain-containing protein n=1 Tax=Trichuris muris TaxID=70415 RepID=A0A5S6QHQ9_TRIMR